MLPFSNMLDFACRRENRGLSSPRDDVSLARQRLDREAMNECTGTYPFA